MSQQPEHLEPGEPVDSPSSTSRGLPGHVSRARHAVRRNPVTRIVWQVLVGVVGAGLLVAGGAMLVLPGPGWAVIALGLVVLASEFVWFERPLRPVRRLMDRAGVTNGSPQRKWFIAVIAVVGMVGGWLVWKWGQHHGWKLPFGQS